MSSFFGGMGRRVGVLIYGDDRQLQKTLARTEGRLATFARKVDASSKSGRFAAAGGIFGGTAQIAGATAFVLAAKKSIDAAKNAQVILGQTSVAVDRAGLSWQRNAGRIEEAATAISKASSFDDEAVLQSFQVFVRGQKNVAKSLELSRLAADVARGRYTDLASATQLVNKAAMGQIGALRRAGIQIDKNATSTQALDALQKAYGGAAEKYTDSAAGGFDRLHVQIQEVEETIGGPLANATGNFASQLADALSVTNNLLQKLGELGKVKIPPIKVPIIEVKVPGSGSTLGRLAGRIGGFGAKLAGSEAVTTLNPILGAYLSGKNIYDLFAGGGGGKASPGKVVTSPVPGAPPNPLAPKTVPTGFPGAPSKPKDPFANLPRLKPNSLVTSVSARLEDDLLNARLSGSDKAVRAALKAEESFIRKTLNQRGLNRKQREGLKNDLLAVTNEIASIDSAAADAAKAAADAAKDAAAESKRKQRDAAKKARDAAKKAAEASKKAARALVDQGNAMKDAALARLDAFQNNRDTLRDLADAKTELRQARMIGGKHGILEARRNLEDAALARKRALLENASVSPSGKNRGAGFDVHIGNLNLNGVQNAKQLVAELSKLSNRSTSQSRGHSPGIPHGL